MKLAGLFSTAARTRNKAIRYLTSVGIATYPTPILIGKLKNLVLGFLCYPTPIVGGCLDEASFLDEAEKVPCFDSDSGGRCVYRYACIRLA